MATIFLYRQKNERMKAGKFAEIAKDMGIENRPVETAEALAVHDGKRALAYAQPGARFGGLLFYSDQTKNQAEDVKKLLDEKSAKRWTDGFLKRFDLSPREVKDDRIKVNVETLSYVTEAVVFDGKERKRKKIKTETGSKILLNDILVDGPRSSIRMVFKDRETPIMMHCGIWENIEVYEERELIREHDVFTVIKEKLAQRQKGEINYDISDIRLAYYAGEYSGGPDLLIPYYFVDIEYEDKKAREMGIAEGIKQIVSVPAYR
ncbi:MAG: hypothetical protein JXR85_00420 [Deltaproteobacteria bacterium]|nr:hypothetical protein [Deltaproteobacteria bacterium]